MRDVLGQLRYPLIGAPMAGGPSTVALAAAISNAGGMGFLASGYDRAARLRQQIQAVRAATDAPFGVNLFMPAHGEIDSAAVVTYLTRLAGEEARYRASLGVPRNDDDDWEEFLSVVRQERPAVVSFTFGCPTAGELASLREREIFTCATINHPGEAVIAQERGVDAVIAQGVEAGGHRGGFDDSARDELLALLPLLALTRASCALPLIASGGIVDGAGVAAALSAGAAAVQMGTVFMLADEAATHPAHRARLTSPAPTGLTRAFSGRSARGIVNRFQAQHTAQAPAAYPAIHYATSPLRAAAREVADADGFNLWAGQAHSLVRGGPAAEIVRALAADAQVAAAHAVRLLSGDHTPGETS